MTTSNPSHLFISYAVEDAELARWLARKLVARGHPVWFDQMKLLGGEPWPQTIDDAIKHRTFRMLALISEHSLRKPKPTGERTMAQRIGEQRKTPDFLISNSHFGPRCGPASGCAVNDRRRGRSWMGCRSFPGLRITR